MQKELNLTLKDLLEIAKEELKDLSNVEHPDFRLEQAVCNNDQNHWEVVVSYLVENTNKRSVGLTGISSDFEYERMYQKLIINPDKQISGLYIFNNK